VWWSGGGGMVGVDSNAAALKPVIALPIGDNARAEQPGQSTCRPGPLTSLAATSTADFTCVLGV
jgi:hypothetical protein